jgi:hypothetical protein
VYEVSAQGDPRCSLLTLARTDVTGTEILGFDPILPTICGGR